VTQTRARVAKVQLVVAVAKLTQARLTTQSITMLIA